MSPIMEHNNNDGEGTVLIFSVRAREPDHERTVHEALGRRIADLLGMRYGGHRQPDTDYTGRVYLIPTDTIIGVTHTRRLRLLTETDLFGGAAPYPFVPTKAITHPVLDEAAVVPEGWSTAFSARTRDAVLAGYTAFSLDDAMRAGTLLLRRGPVRVKPVLATAGRGQVLVHDAAALGKALQLADTERLSDYGIVLEEHLESVQTLSVGRVRVGPHEASYVGTQSLTPDNTGELVYGGSSLLVTRGGFDALLSLDLDDNSRLAITQARRYDEAANACYPGLLAPRRNYDIALGRDARGEWRCGVLEQSWRIGGASAAEIAALQALRDNPAVRAVNAATVERFGANPSLPAGAQLLYQGDDPHIGPLCKYLLVQPAIHDAPRHTLPRSGAGCEGEDHWPPAQYGMAS